MNRAIFEAYRHNDTLANTIKTAMTVLCTLDEMLQRGSADYWADAGKKLTKRAPIIAETMKFICMKLEENSRTVTHGI